MDGCRGAQDALVTAYTRIDELFEQLLEWAKDMEHCQRQMAEHIQSDAFHELVVSLRIVT